MNTLASTDLLVHDIPAEAQARASAVLANMGLTVTDAVRLLLTRIANDKKLPFEPFTPGATTIAAMQEARHGTLPRFASVQALMDDLNAGD
ncbi:MAG: type II toxin-antitoxin system RelB/DinJ family antitoxin [Ottowia sp.]|nr:type II toxin-antitoxin system RelB/DinJ family antitoxin [Ottowia sp.]